MRDLKIIVHDRFLNELITKLSHKYGIRIVTVECHGLPARGTNLYLNNTSAIVVRPRWWQLPVILLNSKQIDGASDVYRVWNIVPLRKGFIKRFIEEIRK